jgi:peptidoglycan/LPS O-acetylase OafA/YrhL
VHFIIVQQTHFVVNQHGGLRSIGNSYLPGQIAVGAIALGISVGVAWLSWNFFESQFLKLKRFVPYEARRPRPAALAPSMATAEAEV